MSKLSLKPTQRAIAMSCEHSGQHELVIEMALMFLPKDGTEWLPRLKDAHLNLSESLVAADAANVPAQVALIAFESMGYQYMEIENGEWRRRLGNVAFRHWMQYRGTGGQ